MGNNSEMVPPAVERSTQIMSEMVNAAQTLADVGLAVSIFGSARIKPTSSYYAKSQLIAKLLAQAGLAVIAGGGPGIMEGANKGAFEAGGTSIGLHVKMETESQPNEFLSIKLPFEHFASRKSTFFMHSVAYIVLPGGYGTLDELFECLTLIQNKRIPACPVILVGKAFWGGLTHWIREHLVANHLVDSADPYLFTVEDDPNTIMEQINRFVATHKNALNNVPNAPV
jgi:uncharacterized protein (TIGR00730 family)